MSLFLIGAGFNIDATREAGPVYGNSIYIGHHQIDCGYPLVADVLKLCFGLDELPTGKSVEDLFSDALQLGNYKPMERLVDRLMAADYYLAHKLATSEQSDSYWKFFEKFDGSQFLTFNYDSLPEIFLSQTGRWYPEDGYGVAVATRLAFGVKLSANEKSASLVIHLHGSACVYTIESEIVGNPVGGIAQLVHRAEPLYAFDPDSTSHCFPRYDRVVSSTGHIRIDERVIAPVPDKSEGLKEAFIRQSYAKALPLVRQAGSLIALGYSFSPYDRVSYNPVLEALAHSHGRTLLVVSPQARELAKRICAEYPDLRVRPVEKTLRGWAADSFRGL
jgi:hypothetical protein